ncbi:TonB-dependent receptor [candidate division KSB1 bacterium]|nr:TonB-dependent receptor [candidate division KSB1 bacterium]
MDMLNKLALYIFTVLFTSYCPATGTGSILGTIVDPSGLAVPNANIYILDHSYGTASKSDGSFSIQLAQGSYELFISHIRYEPVHHQVTIKDHQTEKLFLQFDRERIIQFDQIAVTATKSTKQMEDIPQPVAQISAQEIERRYEYNVGAMLDWVPGIRLIRDGSTIGANYGLSIRSMNGGGFSNKTLVLIDGRPINNGWDGGVDFNMIPSEMVERVEIIKGASSALYGSQATAGVVNVITRSAPKGLHGWLSIANEFDAAGEIPDNKADGYGRAAIAATNLQMNASYRNQQTSHMLTVGYRSALESFPVPQENNWDNYDIKYAIKHTIHKNLAVFAHVDLHKNKWHNNAERIPPAQDYDYRAADIKIDYHTGSGIINARMWNNFSQRQEKSLETALQTGFNNNRWGWIADYTTTVLHRSSIKFGFEGTVDETHVDYQSFVRDMQYRGIEKIGVKDNRTGQITPRMADLYLGAVGQTSQTHSLTNYALFSQVDYQPVKRLNIILGLRADKQSEFGTIVNPKLGFAYKVLDLNRMTTTLKSNYGKGFRAPTMVDLYSGSLSSYGDPNLVPEKTENFDIGVFHRFLDHGYLQVSYFKMNVENLLISDKLGSTGWGQFVVLNTQAGQADTLAFHKRLNRGDYSPEGLELTLKLQLQRLSARASYTYLDPKEFTFQTSKHRYNVDLYYWQNLFNDLLLNFSAQYNYTGEGYFFDYQIRPFEAFSLLDLSMGIEFGHYKISIYSTNFTDTTYRLWHHTWQPGRTFTLRFETRF